MNDDESKPAPADEETRAFSRRQAELVKQRIRQFTGKAYPKLEAEMMKMSGEAIVDLVRFVSDAQSEVTRAKNQAIHQPWRR
jgi:hypothetical protein